MLWVGDAGWGLAVLGVGGAGRGEAGRGGAGRGGVGRGGGRGAGRVIESNGTDSLLVYFADHGPLALTNI